MTVNEIIERIGYIRTRANLSARALSLAIGKTESYINRMEQKGFEPSLSVLLEIIDAADKRTFDFLSTVPEKQQQAIIDLLSPGK